MQQYVLKENDELYDDFYVKYYDQIVYDKLKTDYEFSEICHTTKLTKNSNILDIDVVQEI